MNAEPRCNAFPEDASPADAAERILRESPYLAIRRLKCCCQDGVLVIAGRVPSFYLKQVAVNAVRYLDGVHSIHDLVEVSV